MSLLNAAKLVEISTSVLDKFKLTEKKRWDRKAVVLELIGEIGELAHYVQYWDGYKKGKNGIKKYKLCDECSDVLFIIIRLAIEDRINLPDEIEIPGGGSGRGADYILEMSKLFSNLVDESNGNSSQIITKMLELLGSLALALDIDLSAAHKIEMDIADGYFRAAGEGWPKPNLFKHPIETYRLKKLVKRREAQ